METTLAGRYCITRHIGGGGFGQTYLAEDRQLPGNPLCVVKQLKPQSTDPAALQIARRLFDQEARVLYSLGTCDQIPKLLAHIEQNNEFYLVQEYIEGETLDEELSAGGRWTQSQVVALLREVLDALAFVHQQGVIHRDIKPSNLIRRKSDGRIVLIDFGAVKQVSTTTTGAGSSSFTIAIGSQGYMPTEQIAGRPQYSSDIYAVGMVCIQALTGVTPDQLRQSSRTGELIWQDKTPINAQLGSLLNRMVKYDFRQRFSSAAEALNALSAVVSASPSSIAVASADIASSAPFAHANRAQFNSNAHNLAPTEISTRYQTPPGYDSLPKQSKKSLTDGTRSLIMVISIFALMAAAIGGFAWMNAPATPEDKSGKKEKPASATADTSAMSDDEYFQAGTAHAEDARKMTQAAKTRNEWQTVAQKWNLALQSMKSVPASSPNYKQARQNIAWYQQQIDYATLQASLAPTGTEPPAGAVTASPPAPVIPAPVMPPRRSETTYLSFNTYNLSSGNNIRTFTTENGLFDASVGTSGAYGESVNVRFKGPKDWYDLSLKAPNGARLQIGTYDNAQRYPFQEPGRPGLDFSGNGSGCNTLTGRFVVNEVVYRSSSEIDILDVTFERRCTGDTTIFYGRLRYDRKDQR